MCVFKQNASYEMRISDWNSGVCCSDLAAYVAMRTPLGRKIYAVGGNAQAAALSGIRVNRVLIVTYMVSGFCAAVVGLIIASELQAAHPATGDTFELNAIAAAVLGGDRKSTRLNSSH